jgi:transposase
LILTSKYRQVGGTGVLKIGEMLLKIINWRLKPALAYKALWYGRSQEPVSPQHTSQDCPVCGCRYTGLKLTRRQWAYPACGKIDDRDQYAGHNFIQLFKPVE